MKNKRIEPNIIIAINAMKKIMSLFLGPFLTAYFIKTSQESIVDLSIYNIFSDILLALGSFFVAKIIKNKFKIGMFRIGVILNFIYIMAIIILNNKLTQHLGIISILYGISASCYWFPYNLFVTNKVENIERTGFTVKSKIVNSIIGVACPIILGSIITITNYELTAVIILFISLIQIVLSFILTSEKEDNLPKYNMKRTWKELKNNKYFIKMMEVEFFNGMNISDGALNALITVLIFNSFKTNMNLGIITSITAILSMVFVRLYGKIFKNKDDKKIIIISSIIPVISVLILLAWRNNITVIMYNICYVIFTELLTLTREIRLYNLSDSHIVNKDNQCEFFEIREIILNCGRVTSYLLFLLAGLSRSQLVLNIVMVILTLSILMMGLNTSKLEKFEK